MTTLYPRIPGLLLPVTSNDSAMGVGSPQCPLWVKSGSLAQASRTSAFGGKAEEIGGKADIAILNVRCWGVSRRSDGMAQTSAFSHNRKFVMPAEQATRQGIKVNTSASGAWTLSFVSSGPRSRPRTLRGRQQLQLAAVSRARSCPNRCVAPEGVMVGEGRGRGDQDYASVDHQPAAGDNVGKDQASHVGSLSILTTVVTKRFREEMSLAQNIARVRLGSKADISRPPSECPVWMAPALQGLFSA